MNDKWRGREQGQAVILLLLALVLLMSVGLAVRDPAASHAAHAPAESASALALARTGLKAYALSGGSSTGSPPRPGSLPCPDRTGNGRIDSFPCLNAIHPGASQQGRLPWASLQLPQLTDGAGSRLWYVLDPAVRNSPAAEPINPATAGALTLDGVPGYAAVVLAAGEPLASQRRTAGAPPEAWLEGAHHRPAEQTYINCPIDAADCNDRVIGLHRDRLFEPVQRRLLQEVAALLRQHHAASAADPSERHLPWAAPLGGTACERGRTIGSLPLEPGDCGPGAAIDPSRLPAWVRDNAWLPFIVYHVDPAATLTLNGVGGHAAILAAAGAPLAHQTRGGAPPHDLADYLDDPGNAAGNGWYVDHRPAEPGRDNDAFLGLHLP